MKVGTKKNRIKTTARPVGLFVSSQKQKPFTPEQGDTPFQLEVRGHFS